MSFSSLVSWAAAASRSLSNMAAMPPAISVPAPRSSPSAGAVVQADQAAVAGPASQARLPLQLSRTCLRHYILLRRNLLPWALPALTGPNLGGAPHGRMQRHIRSTRLGDGAPSRCV
jgi:hypothetical protein